MSKKSALIVLVLLAAAIAAGAQEASAAVEPPSAIWKPICAALSVGFGCIGGGIAVAKLGSAAMGAMAEDPSLSGKALPYLGLAEGICLWGFLVALLILLV